VNSLVRHLVFAAVLAWRLMDTSAVAAEWFADLYGGVSFTERSRFSLDGNLDGAPMAGFVPNVSFEKSATVGGRLGYWFERLNIVGVALDAFHFEPDVSAQSAVGMGQMIDTRGALFGVPLNVSGTAPVRLPEIRFGVTALAPEILLRWPLLVSPEFPHGRLQPYVGAGPALYLVTLEGFHPSGFDRKTSIGVTTGGGITVAVRPWLGLFAEYRYTNARPALESGDIVFKTHLATHHLLSGVSFRF